MSNFFSAILYYLVILPISKLPYGVLYKISNFLAFVMGRIVKYRAKVILENLRHSFPEKSEVEIKKIQQGFYLHFSDLIVESLKSFSVSEKQIKEKIKFYDKEVLENLKQKNKSVLFVAAHYGNWEMGGSSFPLFFPGEYYGLYQPFSNQFFNKKIKKIRKQFGIKLLSMYEVKQFFANKPENRYGIFFISDQSPRKAENAYWLNFLNQETGVLFGAEKYAKENNLVVVYAKISRESRGKYRINSTLIAENAEKTAYGEITQKYMQLLEADIKAQPEIWLWSHKRWKRKRPQNIALHAS